MAATNKQSAGRKADNDAYAYLKNELHSWGLDSLAGTVWTYLQRGYSNDRILVELQETAAYKQRFSGNAARVKAGLAPLSPADYLNTEEAYRQALQAEGLPKSFYDSPSDFAVFIGKDISPTEIQQRAKLASDVANNLEPSVKQQLQRLYSPGEITAYFLNPAKTVDMLNRQANAAQAAAEADRAGFGANLDVNLAEKIGDLGLSAGQERQQFVQTKQLAEQVGNLAEIYGGTYTDENAIRDAFLGDTETAKKRKALEAAQNAAFSGQSGVGSKSLGRSSGGNT
jgi:hypothetical protein